MNEPLSAADLDQLLQGVRWEGPAHDERYSLSLERRGDGLFLVVVGKVMQPIPAEFSDRLRGVFTKSNGANTVIDLTHCTYLASAALGFLVEFFHIVTSNGARVVLMKPNDRVRAIIGLLGLNQFFTLVEDEAAARAAFATARIPKP